MINWIKILNGMNLAECKDALSRLEYEMETEDLSPREAHDLTVHIGLVQMRIDEIEEKVLI